MKNHMIIFEEDSKVPKVWFYDIEVFRYEWIIVFKTFPEYHLTFSIHNNKFELEGIMAYLNALIGFNNYFYDDIILTAILSGANNKEIFELSQNIINKKNTDTLRMYKYKARLLPSLDMRQELPLNISLKEIEANLLQNIQETPIDFNIDRHLTDDEVDMVTKYCEHDVSTTIDIYKYRHDYFESKMEIVKTFGFSKTDVKLTRAQLASKCLKCTRYSNHEADRLNITYNKNIRWENIPIPIKDFYTSIQNRFATNPELTEDLEKEKLEYNLLGVPHIYGFGGLHGAISNLIYEGHMLCIDVGSYYPSLMINNNFISRNSANPKLYKDIYDKRMEYKKNKDPKQQVYKILLNATFGAMKQKANDLYDPVQSNNIAVNGQLILTDLIMRLAKYIHLIQSNTDGLIVAYDDKDKDVIVSICQNWEKEYDLKLDYEYATKIIQRDVNNYILQYEDGHIKTKGTFGNNKGGSFDKNNLTIIDMALTNYYITGTDPTRYIADLISQNNLTPFQLIAKKGGTFAKMYHEVNNTMQEVQHVNRVFATWDKKYGSLYKVKIVKDKTESIQKSLLKDSQDKVKESLYKIPNCPEHAMICNDDIGKTDKSKLDLSYYLNLINQSKLKNIRGLNDV